MSDSYNAEDPTLAYKTMSIADSETSSLLSTVSSPSSSSTTMGPRVPSIVGEGKRNEWEAGRGCGCHGDLQVGAGWLCGGRKV